MTFQDYLECLWLLLSAVCFGITAFTLFVCVVVAGFYSFLAIGEWKLSLSSKTRQRLDNSVPFIVVFLLIVFALVVIPIGMYQDGICC